MYFCWIISVAVAFDFVHPNTKENTGAGKFAVQINGMPLTIGLYKMLNTQDEITVCLLKGY